MLAASLLNMRSVKTVYSSFRTLHSERIVLPNAFFKIFLITLLGFEQDSIARGISGGLKLSSEKLSTGEKAASFTAHCYHGIGYVFGIQVPD